MTEFQWANVLVFGFNALFAAWYAWRQAAHERVLRVAWRINQNTLAEIQACFRRIDNEETLLRDRWQRLWHADSILRASIAEHRRQVAAAEAKSADAEPGTADKTPL